METPCINGRGRIRTPNVRGKQANHWADEPRVFLFSSLVWIAGQEDVCPSSSLSSTRAIGVKVRVPSLPLYWWPHPHRDAHSPSYGPEVSFSFPQELMALTGPESLLDPVRPTASLPSCSLCTNFTPDHEVGGMSAPLFPSHHLGLLAQTGLECACLNWVPHSTPTLVHSPPLLPHQVQLTYWEGTMVQWMALAPRSGAADLGKGTGRPFCRHTADSLSSDSL